jgi:hypothetical protein
MPFPQDAIRMEFVLSFEEWLEARLSRPRNEKERRALHADYLHFSAERRSFQADGHGWTYTFSEGKAEHSWKDMMGLAEYHCTFVLMTMQGHYVVPHSALEKNEMNRLKTWLKAVMSDSIS